MAKRPLFTPLAGPDVGVREVTIEFQWFPGMAKIQKQRSIRSLHDRASHQKIDPVLEVSSKSEEELGIRLSAFNLRFTPPALSRSLSVETAFQASKVFERGGPYTDLLKKTSREAKKDIRLRESGSLVAFSFLGQVFQLDPKSFFYDWLYINALSERPDLCDAVMRYRGFTDIEFNPKKSINCQAYSVALFSSIKSAGLLPGALASPDAFREILMNEYRNRDRDVQVQGMLF
jgi:hypothetical protein